MTLALEKNSVRSDGVSASVETSLRREDPVLEALREIVAEVKGLRADLAQSQRHRSETVALSRTDRTLLARLLPAIGGAVGSEPFLVRDLFQHPSAALRLVFRKLNTRQVGRLLRRAEGHAVDGYLVEPAGVELGAVLWRVVQVAEFPGNENLSVPSTPSRDLP